MISGYDEIFTSKSNSPRKEDVFWQMWDVGVGRGGGVPLRPQNGNFGAEMAPANFSQNPYSEYYYDIFCCFHPL